MQAQMRLIQIITSNLQKMVQITLGFHQKLSQIKMAIFITNILAQISRWWKGKIRTIVWIFWAQKSRQILGQFWCCEVFFSWLEIV
jgi:hypothetical protein